jgi:hypothetical protein
MKKISTLIILILLLVSESISAQCFDYYRQTPLGSNIKACSGGAYPDWYVQQADAQTRTYAIEVLESGTDSYNCHAYAWHVKDGGDKVWINNLGNEIHNIDNYWLDHSYVVTSFLSGVPNLKVFYGSTSPSSDHTAITTSDPNIFISKMGCGALVRHYKNNSPYDNSNLTYYKFNLPISGPTQVCDQATYTVDAAGATVAWSATPSGVVSLQPNGSSVTLTKVGNGKVTLSAMINNSFTVTKDIWVGAPKLMSYTTTPKQLCAGEPFIFNAVIPDGSTITSATGLSEGTEIPLSTINSTSYEVPGDVSRITLSIENSCGNVTVRKLIPKANCLNYYFSITPNPSSNNATISMTSFTNASTSTLLSASASSSVSTSYSVKVLDVYGSIVYTGKKTGKQFTIPTAPLRNGVYSIIVSDGTNTYQDKLIVKH